MRTLKLAAVLAVLAGPAWAAAAEFPDPPPAGWQAQAELFGRVAPSPDDDGVIAWERTHQAALSSGFLFDLSRRLLARDPDAAMEWYVVAMVRGRYDAGRCVDDTAGRAVSRLSGMAAEVLRYGETHRSQFAVAGQKALARSDLFGHAVHPDWVCVQALSGMGGRSAGITPAAHWPALEQKLRRDWTRQFEAMAAR